MPGIPNFIFFPRRPLHQVSKRLNVRGRGRQTTVVLGFALGVFFLLSGCGGDTEAPATGESSLESGERDTATGSGDDQAGDEPSQTTVAGAQQSSDEQEQSEEPGPLCDGLSATTAGSVVNDRLVESSGLAVSERHDGVIWAHNDSGHAAEIFAVGFGGEDLGSVALKATSGIDIEDMALVDGVVHLADIGDNDEARSEVLVYRFDEPDPSAEETGLVERLVLRYPDGPHNAESFLVDPLTGELVIVAKQVMIGDSTSGLFTAGPATIYRGDPTPGADGIIALEVAGSVALDELTGLAVGQALDGRARQLGVSGVATAIDIRADGRAIALRTYDTVWLFTREVDETVAEALAGVPCEVPTISEEKGEAVAFFGGSVNLVTIAEGDNPAVNLIRGP